MTKSPTTSQTRSTALCMALYTFLLALGAALPIAASYSDAIQARTDGTHIQGGAYQRREQIVADCADEQAQAERPRVAGVCLERAANAAPHPTAPDLTANPALTPTDSRGS